MDIQFTPEDARAIVAMCDGIIRRSERLIAAYERKRSWSISERAMAIAGERINSQTALALKSQIRNHPQYQG